MKCPRVKQERHVQAEEIYALIDVYKCTFKPKHDAMDFLDTCFVPQNLIGW